jgi:phosphatidylglycerophosphate synthase
VTTRYLYGTDELDIELSIWAGAQLTVLSLLWASIGLHPAGWLAGAVYAAVAGGTLTFALHRSWTGSLGPANRVTLARAMLIGGVTALAADSFTNHPPVVVLVVLAAVALVLDAVDGLVARRTGTATALGARFDMELDAFLILVLSIVVSMSLGAWVLAIGAMRYTFVAAGRLLPWLRSALPVSFARKTVAAVQGVVLVVAAAGVLPGPVTAALVAVALALLVWSFGRDVGWLWRTRSRGSRGSGSRRSPLPTSRTVR